MKNLFIALSCFAAIILTSSCTPDSPVDTAKENQITPTKIPDPRTEVFADEDPLPDGEPIKDISH